jgi:hypothetical protein
MSRTSVHGIRASLTRAALAATLLLTLTACATGYHSASNPILGFTGGYWDEPGPGRTWRVGVTGNAYLSPERAGAYLLYRCAEVSLREGGTHFVVYPSLSAAVSDDRQAGLGVGAGAKPYATVYLWIAPADAEHAHSAEEVLARLGPVVKPGRVEAPDERSGDRSSEPATPARAGAGP